MAIVLLMANRKLQPSRREAADLALGYPLILEIRWFRGLCPNVQQKVMDRIGRPRFAMRIMAS